MKIKAIVLSGLGTLGLFASCKSNQTAYNNAKQQQYSIIENEKEIINKYGYSTLKPNGKLSSIEGKDILYFLTQNDSIAYENANKLSNGLIKKAQIENQNRTEQLSNNYIQTKVATNEYYKTAMNNSLSTGQLLDLHFNYKNTLENLEQNNTILSKETRNSYIKQINKAYKEGKQIRKSAREALGVVVRKMP